MSLRVALLTALLCWVSPGLAQISVATSPLYLRATGVPSGTLSTSVPTTTTLANLDSSRDSDAGLMVKKGGSGAGESDATKYQRWLSPASGVTLSGRLQLKLWTAMKDFNTSKKGSVTAYLRDCNSSGSSCTTIDTATLTANPWTSSGSWVQKTIDFDSVSYTVSSGRTLELKLIVSSGSDDDMWFAYDTTSYTSVLATGSHEQTLIGEYRFEDASWTGATGEVADSSGSGFHGTAAGLSSTLPTTSGDSPAVGSTSGTCRYGVFNRSNKQYIALPGAFTDLSTIGSFTVTAWIRTTDRTRDGQRIVIQDQSGHATSSSGWIFSLGDRGAGKLNFYTRRTSFPLSDETITAAVVSNDTWYFVAAIVDASTRTKYVYVYSSAGSLLANVSTTYSGSIGPVAGPVSIGGETNSASGGENSSSFGFAGNIDEVRVYAAALSSTELAAVRTMTATCAGAGVDHYELTVPSASLACTSSTVSVTACADSSSPCSSPSSAVAGQTATLSAGGGATLGSSLLSFDAAGSASTTLSYPAAGDGASVTVTLGGESLAASNPRKCCPDGAGCSATSSCSSVFRTAGFIVAASAGGTAATLPAQTAGTASATAYLRAVRTSTTTKACEAALTGAASVDWALQCVDPSSCSSGNRMTLTGSSATAIASNPASGVSSRTAVNMVFDADGNAPFSFSYADVGQVSLSASKTVNGAALTGSSNAFVVKPAGFAIGAVQQAASPQLANPGATSAAGARFVKAGESFGLSVTALTSSGATAPNFGRESSPEGVLLTPALVLPAGGSSGTLANATLAGGSFSNGVASTSTLAYSEVGIITLTPSVADGNYLGAGAASGSASGPIGRFYPARFALSGGSVTHRSSRSCTPAATASPLGENFSLAFTLSAQNLAGATTLNYSGSFALFDPATAAAWNLAGLDGSTAFSVAGGRLALGSASGSWSSGQATVTLSAQALRAAAPDGPFNAAFGVAPQDSDGVALDTLDMASTAGGANDRGRIAAVALRFARLRLDNATGAADRALALPLTAQYWNGSAWSTDTLDSCSTLPAGAASFGNLRGTLLAADLAASPAVALAAGIGRLRLPAPGGGRRGSVDVALSLGSSASDASCLQSWTPALAATSGANLAQLRSNWCGSSHDKDTAARASFGLPRTQGHLLHRRENF